MNGTGGKLPASIITGFLGAGKTTLIRRLLEGAEGRRLAILVNEFGTLGIDGELLKHCGIAGCAEDNIIELTNGCICCTVAEDFLPSMERLLDLPLPPEHILIETSGLALPKPLIKAFQWPSIRPRVTVDGVIAVLDAEAVAAGRFAPDPQALLQQRAADAALAHDNPLAEVYEDQLQAADLIVLNKIDQIDAETQRRVIAEIAAKLPRAVKILPARHGAVDPLVLLGLNAKAEADLASRPSHHDGLDAEHDHDDFESFVVELQEVESLEALAERMQRSAEMHNILRMKGFVAVRSKAARGLVQGVGRRIRYYFDRPWQAGEARTSRIVIIGLAGLDRAAITASLRD
jgi:cobalamin biosynthesis protein CobW